MNRKKKEILKKMEKIKIFSGKWKLKINKNVISSDKH